MNHWALMLGQLPATAQRLQVLRVRYGDASGQPSQRLIRPLRLSQHGWHWYLHAYCTVRQDERVFRLDRIDEVQVVGRRGRRGGGGGRARATPDEANALPLTGTRRAERRAGPPMGSGFFPNPPSPPPGSPLVRVWLEE